MNYSRLFSFGFLCILSLALLTSSCRKYPDGPTFSLRSKTARVVNSWTAQLIARNNIDETVDFDIYTLDFRDNNTLTWTIQKTGEDPVVIEAEWELASVNEQIKLTFTSSPIPWEDNSLLFLDIRKLEEEEMWLKFLVDGDYWDLQLQ